MSNWLVGIDLGTSNTALARIAGTDGKVETLRLTQRTSETDVRDQALLPSLVYLPGAYELPEGSLGLPWDAKRDFLVGEFARVQGSRVPGRVVVSAKSWLAHRQARLGPAQLGHLPATRHELLLHHCVLNIGRRV